MRRSMAMVLGRLVEEGLAPPDAPARARAALADDALAGEAAVPWYVRVAAGVGAWVATAFFVAFLFTAGIEPDEPAALLVGAALVVGAVLLRRRATAEFARQLALAASFAGQALVVFRVGEATDSLQLAALAALALSAALIVLMPDAPHRFMSAVVGAVAVFTAAVELRLAWGVGAPGPDFRVLARGGDVAALALVAFAAWTWRADPRRRGAALARVLEPVGHGTVVALLGMLLLDAFLTPAIAAGARDAARWQLGAATTVGVAVALCALVVAIARERGLAAREPVLAAIGGALFLAALTLSTPGIVAAVALLALGFDRRNVVLVGLAALFLIAFTTLYYHSLRLTLLEKSGVLLASGVLLLAAAAYVTRRFRAGAGVEITR
jgi:hypothetical protein